MRLFLPLLGGANDKLSLAAAFALADGCNAHIDACLVRPDPETEIPRFGAVDPSIEGRREDCKRHAEQASIQTLKKAHRQFNSACRPLLFAPGATMAVPMETVVIAWHGPSSRGFTVPKNHNSTAHAFMLEASERDADILVMGGFAHNRFEDLVFGGTTLEMSGSLFLAHFDDSLIRDSGRHEKRSQHRNQHHRSG